MDLSVRVYILLGVVSILKSKYCTIRLIGITIARRSAARITARSPEKLNVRFDACFLELFSILNYPLFQRFFSIEIIVQPRKITIIEIKKTTSDILTSP